MLACEKGNLEMASALLSYKHLNLLHSDKRQLNAAFYAIENRGREDSESILRLLLEREASLVFFKKDSGKQRSRQSNAFDCGYSEVQSRTGKVVAVVQGRPELASA